MPILKTISLSMLLLSPLSFFSLKVVFINNVLILNKAALKETSKVFHSSQTQMYKNMV
jgi:hypothetical protein